MSNEIYRVRLVWGDTMETQIAACYSLDKAKQIAKQAVPGYKVFNSKGKVVYTTGELHPDAQIEIAVDWAIKTANDDSHGYNNEYNHRGGNPDYACSSYVNQAWKEAGVIALPQSKDMYTAQMKQVYIASGFVDVSDQVNLKTGEGVKAGDVLLTGGHVEMCVNDNGSLAGARGNAPTNLPENGAPGDQTGGEIAVIGWWDFNWHTCLRYVGNKPKFIKRYGVMCGFFNKKETAERRKARLEKAGFKVKIIKRNGGYICRCGVYQFKANAQKKIDKMKKAGFTALIYNR